MHLLRALWKDAQSSIVRGAWVSFLVGSIPGETGFVLRRRFIGGRFGSLGEGGRIYPGAAIFGAHNLHVGNNCRIGYQNIFQASGGIHIGNDVLFGPGVKVWSVNHISARVDQAILEQGYEHKKVIIGNGVWIGANVFIMSGAHIGDGVVIAAGSVVAGKSIAPYSILAGNPARPIGTRIERMPAGGGQTSSSAG